MLVVQKKNSGYFIGRDDNGEPFIAHAFGANSGLSKHGSSRKNHKYLAKVQEGNKTRYFYTQKEIDAYYTERSKLSVKNVLKSTFGPKAKPVEYSKEATTAKGDKVKGMKKTLDELTKQRNNAMKASNDALEKENEAYKNYEKNPNDFSSSLAYLSMRKEYEKQRNEYRKLSNKIADLEDQLGEEEALYQIMVKSKEK